MTHAFTPPQSAAINDRIVQMIAAAIGEGPGARRARAIANEDYLDRQGEVDDDGILPLNLQLIATAPHDRFVLTHCPEAPRCGTWPTAPWILARWRDVTDAWHDEEGIRVRPTGWLPLTDQSLRILSPEDSGRPERALPSEGSTRLPNIRLECLKLALQHAGTDLQRAVNLAAEFERQVQTGFRTSLDPRITADTALIAAILSEAADTPEQPGQDADDHRRRPALPADRADHE